MITSNKKHTQQEDTNNLINLGRIKAEILDQYGSIYQYCLRNGISESNMSNFLHKKMPITLKALNRHCINLGLNLSVSIDRQKSTTR
jgi:hypothetical protein